MNAMSSNPLIGAPFGSSRGVSYRPIPKYDLKQTRLELAPRSAPTCATRTLDGIDHFRPGRTELLHPAAGQVNN